MSQYRAFSCHLLPPFLVQGGGKTRKQAAASGQNLAELAMTLPMSIALILVTIDLGRAWFAFEGAKMAAVSGAHAAAIYQNASVGETELNTKLLGAGLTAQTAKVNQVSLQHAYQADVSVEFKPLFGGISLPSIGGAINLLPSTINIEYKAISESTLY